MEILLLAPCRIASCSLPAGPYTAYIRNVYPPDLLLIRTRIHRYWNGTGPRNILCECVPGLWRVEKYRQVRLYITRGWRLLDRFPPVLAFAEIRELIRSRFGNFAAILVAQTGKSYKSGFESSVMFLLQAMLQDFIQGVFLSPLPPNTFMAY